MWSTVVLLAAFFGSIHGSKWQQEIAPQVVAPYPLLKTKKVHIFFTRLLGGGFKYFLCSPNDPFRLTCFSNRLNPPSTSFKW